MVFSASQGHIFLSPPPEVNNSATQFDSLSQLGPKPHHHFSPPQTAALSASPLNTHPILLQQKRRQTWTVTVKKMFVSTKLVTKIHSVTEQWGPLGGSEVLRARGENCFRWQTNIKMARTKLRVSSSENGWATVLAVSAICSPQRGASISVGVLKVSKLGGNSLLSC